MISNDTLLKFLILSCIWVYTAVLFVHNVPARSFSFSVISIFQGCFFVFICFLILVYENDSSPEGFIFHSLCMSGLLLASGVLYAYVAPYTPHRIIDPLLYGFDKKIGFSLVPIVKWSLQHRMLRDIFLFAYETIFASLITLLVVLCILGDRRQVKRYLLAMYLSYLLGAIFYYYFPSLDPAATIKHLHFNRSQWQVVSQFYLAHHHKHLYFHNFAFIGFPSFHVIWACLIVFYSRKRRLLFYPFLLLSVLVFPSTLISAWHYLTDVLGGFIFAIFVIVLTEWISGRLEQSMSKVFVPIKTDGIGFLQDTFEHANTKTLSYLQVFSILLLCLTVYWRQAFIMIGGYLWILYHGLLWRKQQR